MGFPSRRARSRASNRAPGEILVQEWKGSAMEKALVSVHPERFDDVQQVALSVLFIIGNEVYGSRRNLGSTSLGVTIDRNTGDLAYTADDKGKHAQTVLQHITRTLGNLPEGFAEMPEPKAVQRTKAQKYSCAVCGSNVRYANTVMLEALCLHAGKPQHGQPAAPFVLQQPKAKIEQPQPPTQAENIQNVIKAVQAGAAKIVHGGTSARNFGMEASA